MLNILDGKGIDAREGLVEEHKRRRDDQRARHLHSPPLSAREQVTVAATDLLQTQFLDQLLEALAPLVRGQGQGLKHRQDVLFHREFSEDGRLLRKVTDAVSRSQVHGQTGDVNPVQEHFPRVGEGQPHDEVKGGSLAGAVGTEQPHHFSLTDSEVDIVNDPASFV